MHFFYYFLYLFSYPCFFQNAYFNFFYKFIFLLHLFLLPLCCFSIIYILLLLLLVLYPELILNSFIAFLISFGSTLSSILCRKVAIQIRLFTVFMVENFNINLFLKNFGIGTIQLRSH